MMKLSRMGDQRLNLTAGWATGEQETRRKDSAQKKVNQKAAKQPAKTGDLTKAKRYDFLAPK